MICPSCGSEVTDAKFCENCGSPLPVSSQAPVAQQEAAQPTYPTAQPTYPVSQPTEPVQSGYAAEVPGESAWQAQPQQAYQTQQTLQMPAQGAAGGYVPPAGAPQAPFQQPPQGQRPLGGQAPNAAFVLVIVGLVLSILFVTFLPGLICSIIGLVLNAGYNKKGLNNPRKTSTTVIGIIGIVIAVLSAVLAIFIGVVTAQVVEEIDRQGIDVTTDSIEVTTDSSGNINITVTNSSGSSAATGASSGAASSAASGAASSSAAASSAAAGAFDEDKYHDAEWNPSLYSIVELTGGEMAALLDDYNFTWDSSRMAWTAADGSLYAAQDRTGYFAQTQIESLPKGAAGQAVVIALFAAGYGSPSKAFSGLSKGVVVEDMYGDDEGFFGVVYGPSMVRHLVIVTPTESGADAFLVFTEEAISSGLFAELIGVDAGTTMDEVWHSITGEHIGGYVSKQ